MFTLDDVLAGTRGRLIAGNRNAAFRAVAIDSRRAGLGDLFVAFRGQEHDGHDFVLDALTRGAAGALVEHVLEGQPWGSPAWTGQPVILATSTLQGLQDLARYWRCRHDCIVVGVTGSVGKTTTKDVIAGLLAQHMPVLRTPANLNTDIGVPLTLMQLEPSHRAAVLEMGMNDLGEIRLLARLALPSIGVVTNIQPSHLERLGTMDRIAEAKSELVQELPAAGLAVLNADDERVRHMAGKGRADVVLYGLAPEAAVAATDIESHGLGGIEFTVRYAQHQLRARMGLVGKHSVYAALAAVAVALRVGMSFEEAVGGLMRVENGIRLAAVRGIRGSTILDDTYNASPASTLAALNLLAEMEGRRVAVLGDMLELGSFEGEGHRIVGRRAAGVADWLITVGARARTIAEEARTAGMHADAVESFDRNREVIHRLERGLRPGDFVLVKGSHSVELDEVVDAIRVAA